MPRWFWSADCALIALPFCAAGEWARTWRPRITNRWSPASIGCAGIAAGIAVLGLSRIAGRFDLNNMVFGDLPWLYFPISALGIFCVTALASLFGSDRRSAWLARNTIVIFPLHFLMFGVFTGVAIRGLEVDPSFKTSSPLAGVIYTSLALLLSWPAARVIRTFFPIAVTGALAARRSVPACPTASGPSGT